MSVDANTTTNNNNNNNKNGSSSISLSSVPDAIWDAYLEEVYTYLGVVENRLFSEGLHVLGRAPDGPQMRSYLSAYFENQEQDSNSSNSSNSSDSSNSSSNSSSSSSSQGLGLGLPEPLPAWLEQIADAASDEDAQRVLRREQVSHITRTYISSTPQNTYHRTLTSSNPNVI